MAHWSPTQSPNIQTLESIHFLLTENYFETMNWPWLNNCCLWRLEMLDYKVWSARLLDLGPSTWWRCLPLSRAPSRLECNKGSQTLITRPNPVQSHGSDPTSSCRASEALMPLFLAKASSGHFERILGLIRTHTHTHSLYNYVLYTFEANYFFRGGPLELYQAHLQLLQSSNGKVG